MWEAARASNVQYFEASMQKIRDKSDDAYNALNRLNRRKWTPCAFRKGNCCDMLTNNHAEAFNICIMKARDQPILTMLNTIHQIIMKRLTVDQKVKEKWTGAVCPRVHKLLDHREKLTENYITHFCGNLTYEKENKDSRMFVDRVFLRETFLKVYSHYLVPIGGPTFWPKTNYSTILPPDVRVLPGRPKRNRNIDPQELREKKEKEVEEQAKRAKKRKEDAQTGTYRASRKGSSITCGHCKKKGHNKKGCEVLLNEQLDAELDEMVRQGGEGTSAPARETMSQPPPTTTEQGDGSSSRPTPASSQPHPTRKKRKTRS